MNKVLHVLVYVFLVLAAAGLYFELQLNDKRSLLTDRNRLQEDYLVKIAHTIEKDEPSKDASFEIKKDVSPVEARYVDSPDVENVLEEYPAQLEQANLETFNWESQSVRSQLRAVYVLDAEGKPVMDGNQPLMRGKGTEEELLSQLFEAAKVQQSRLNSTRAALADLRGKLASVVAEYNKLKPESRQDKVSFAEQKDKVAKLEAEKTELENQVVKVKSQIGELNSKISSLNDEVNTAKEDAEAEREKTAKAEKKIEQLQKFLQQQISNPGTSSSSASSAIAAVTSLPAGEKGVITVADNDSMFAIVKFTDEAMKQLKGDDLSKPLPVIELGVKRQGFKGPAGEFVGRIRLRQEVKGKNFVICDVLGSWEQSKLIKNDTIFAD